MTGENAAIEKVQLANKAYQHYQAGVMAFRAHLMRDDFEAAEAERLKLMSALEAWLDHVMAAKRLGIMIT